VLAAVAAGACGPRDPDPPAEGAIAVLREHFLHDEAASWLRSGMTQASLRSAAADLGFLFDGSGRQGEQAVDGFTRGLGDAAAAPLAGLTAVYAGTGQLDSLTVVALAPVLREEAQALVKSSRESVDARSGSTPVTLYLLGAERLTPERLMRVTVRLDKGRSAGYSVMYGLTPP
jgi:hypothetical protein